MRYALLLIAILTMAATMGCVVLPSASTPAYADVRQGGIK